MAVGWGHAPVIARSKPGPLGENQDPTRTKHAARGRGACPQAPSPAATQQRTRAPTGSAQHAGNLGSMRRLGKFVALGLPLFNTRLLLEPAAARSSCSMVQNSKYYFATGQRGADGKRAVASATTSILRKAPKKKSAPHPNIVNRSVRTLAAHASTVTPKRRHVA